ncbi:hypothetical protein F4679DRAFT_581815 [Xylaria curta]|nr:hypothetical protein F4679DRAFT_581815 [Xylaria curta]
MGVWAYPAWSAPAFLFSTSPRRYGCIIGVWGARHITCNQILRSELLALLCLLEIAGTRALQHGMLAKHQTVFLLSFTRNRACVLEARFEAIDKISVCIRQVLDEVPAIGKRDEAFKDVISWSMFMDSSVLGVSDDSASTASTVVDRESSLLLEKHKRHRSHSGMSVRSPASASTAAAIMNSYSDKGIKWSPETSFSEEEDEEDDDEDK